MPSSESNQQGPVDNGRSLFFVGGPTSSGKTTYAIALAKERNAEIISADAFQIYRGLETLTAAPTLEEQARVPHHLISFLSPAAEFDITHFLDVAGKAIDEIQSRGKSVLIVGGNGHYINSLVHGLSDLPQPDPDLRAKLDQLSTSDLVTRYRKTDPRGADLIDLNNRRRLIRAIEVTELSGEPYSNLRRDWNPELPTPQKPSNGVQLSPDRDTLYARINDRVAAIFDKAVEEVRAVEQFSTTSKQVIGYQEISAFLDGKIDRHSAIELMQQTTRRYAKRQMTWFRNQTDFEIVPS